MIDQDETHWTRYLTTKLVCIPGGKPLLKLSVKQLATATLASTFLMFGSLQVNAAECGGNFSSFIKGVQKEALANGISKNAVNAALKNARLDKKVLSRDRAQGVFRQTFLEFSRRSVSKNRLQHGAKNLKKYASVFSRAEQEFGVPGPVIAAFWGLETDFGAVQGDFNTMNALVTLAHDCRRPELFRPQLLAAIEMVERGDLSPSQTTGAWAGEIGQVQMLPEDIVRFGTDGDGNGTVDLKKSSPDAILTAAKFIQDLGWKAGQPWIQEITLPSGDFPYEMSGLAKGMRAGDWAKFGVTAKNGNLPTATLPADLLLPQGRKGPAFLAYPNFSIYLEWNQSFIYTTSAAYFATRLNGSSSYTKGNPDGGLNDAQMKQLQNTLAKRGYDVGKVDGILGSRTRNAVQAEQQRLNMPADAWPTPALLNKL